MGCRVMATEGELFLSYFEAYYCIELGEDDLFKYF